MGMDPLDKLCWDQWSADMIILSLTKGSAHMTKGKWIVWGNGNGSFGQALLRSVKSTQTLHFSFFFWTTTTLANHLGNFTSLIIFALRSLSTSSWMMIFLSGANFLLFWCIGLKLQSIPNLWVITSLEIPVMSSCFQAKVEILDFSNSVNSCSISSGILLPISAFCSGSSGFRNTSLTSCSRDSKTL